MNNRELVNNKLLIGVSFTRNVAREYQSSAIVLMLKEYNISQKRKYAIMWK